MKHDLIIITPDGKSLYQSMIDRMIKSIMTSIDDIEYDKFSPPDDVEGECAIEVEEDV